MQSLRPLPPKKTTFLVELKASWKILPRPPHALPSGRPFLNDKVRIPGPQPRGSYRGRPTGSSDLTPTPVDSSGCLGPVLWGVDYFLVNQIECGNLPGQFVGTKVAFVTQISATYQRD